MSTSPTNAPADPAQEILLIDQDGVLADFDQHYHQRIREEFPKLRDPDRIQRSAEKIYDEYGAEWREPLRALVREDGFYLALPTIDGAAEAFAALQAAGWDVRICTSPLRDKPSCVAEKLAWIERELGEPARQRTIVTRDKTLVRGRYLIDDRPSINGLLSPTWEHLRYDSPIPGGPPPTLRWTDSSTWNWLV